jgi:hypothetical protein
LKVYDGNGELARELRVQVPDSLDLPTLDLLHRKAVESVNCSYAVLEAGWRIKALFLHHQLVPSRAVVTGVRRRSPGRWLTTTVTLDEAAGGRGALGPDLFFRQVDIDAQHAWLAPLILRLGPQMHPRQLDLADGILQTWESRGERFYYRDHGVDWHLYGAGNTPLLRLEQAIHLDAPKSVDDYLWAVGAISLNRRRRRSA